MFEIEIIKFEAQDVITASYTEDVEDDIIDPSEPGEGGETNPTVPSEPGEGGETDPTDPSEPGEGGETDPTDPSEPGEGGETDPTDPSVPGEGGETDPTDPSVPGEGDHPTEQPSNPNACYCSPNHLHIGTDHPSWIPSKFGNWSYLWNCRASSHNCNWIH